MFSAVSTSEKTILLAFRGTIGLEQFWDELKSGYNMTQYYDPIIFVNIYFLTSTLTLWNTTVKDLVTDPQYTGFNIILTGHSLGGALATLTAYTIVITRLLVGIT